MIRWRRITTGTCLPHSGFLRLGHFVWEPRTLKGGEVAASRALLVSGAVPIEPLMLEDHRAVRVSAASCTAYSGLNEIWECFPVKWLCNKGQKLAALPACKKRGSKSVEEAGCYYIISLQDNCQLYLDLIFSCRRVIKNKFIVFTLENWDIWIKSLKKTVLYLPLEHISSAGDHLLHDCEWASKGKDFLHSGSLWAGTELSQLPVKVSQVFVTLK